MQLKHYQGTLPTSGKYAGRSSRSWGIQQVGNLFKPTQEISLFFLMMSLSSWLN